MLCNNCLRNDAFEFSVREEMNILGLSVRAATHSIKCVACGHVETDSWSRQDFHLEVARALAASGVSSRRAFEYIMRVLGLPEPELGIALGVGEERVRRWLEGLEPVPAGAMQVLSRLLGPAAPAEPEPAASAVACFAGGN